jgi:hypothetical protein
MNGLCTLISEIFCVDVNVIASGPFFRKSILIPSSIEQLSMTSPVI